MCMQVATLTRIYFKILIRDIGYLALLASSPFLLHISLLMRGLPEEIYGYSITLALTVLAPLFAVVLHTFNAANLFKLEIKLGFSQAVSLFLPNLLSAVPLLAVVFAIRSPELLSIVLLSLATTSFVLVYDRPKSAMVAVLPLLLLPFQEYEVSAIYALLPLSVLLIKRIDVGPRIAGGITIFPHHVILPLTAILITGIPMLVNSTEVYLTSSGMGMINPDFMNPLLVIDMVVFQILLIILPFVVLMYARSADVKMGETRLTVGTPVRRRVTAILSAVALSAFTVLSTSILLSFSGILHVDHIFILNLSLASVFANLLIPADPDRSSRSLLSLILYFVVAFGSPFPLTILLLLALLCLYDADVKIVRWFSTVSGDFNAEG